MRRERERGKRWGQCVGTEGALWGWGVGRGGEVRKNGDRISPDRTRAMDGERAGENKLRGMTGDLKADLKREIGLQLVIILSAISFYQLLFPLLR